MPADFPHKQFGRNQIESFADVCANDRHLFATAGTQLLLRRNIRLDDFAFQVSRYFLGLLFTTTTFLWLRALVVFFEFTVGRFVTDVEQVQLRVIFNVPFG